MAFGVKLLGMAETIYGLALILIIIFLPEGIYGSLHTRAARPAAAAGRVGGGGPGGGPTAVAGVANGGGVAVE